MADDGKIEAAAAIRLVLALESGCLNELAIKEAFGDAAVDSLSEVAQAFGVAAATVRHTWRRDGMPGNARAKCWPLADILIWFLKRKLANSIARGADDYTQRKREAETRAAEADAAIKEKKVEVITGEYLPLSVAVSVVKACANKFRDGLMGVSRKLQPMFPPRYQVQLTEEVDREHRNLLTAFCEASTSDLRQAANEKEESDV